MVSCRNVATVRTGGRDVNERLDITQTVVVDTNALVAGGTDDVSGISEVIHCGDLFLIVFARFDLFAFGKLPAFDRFIRSGRGQFDAVHPPGDIEYVVGMPLERLYQ